MTAGPPPYAPGRTPIVGHSLAFLRDPLGSLEQWGETDETVVRLRIAGREVALVTDPAAVESVLVTESDAYRKAEVVRDRLGTLQGGSLVLLEGEAWRERRRLLQSGFGRERAEAVGALSARYAAESVDGWPTDSPVRVDQRASDLSLAVLARALFGLDLRGERTPIHEAADDVLARMDMRSVSTYLPEWVPTPTNRRFRRAVATLHDRLDRTVERRARSRDPGSEPGDTREPPTDLLSTMLAAGLDTETVRDELVAFLFAGFDSTATALACTLALLADHPDVQAAVNAELDEVVGGGVPAPGEIASLPTLGAVVRESLRLYPPQYLLFREPAATTTLAGHRIAPGTVTVLPPWVLHRDRRFWDEPTRFRPARWLDRRDAETDPDRPEYAYFPYGGGPRHCLGARMADRALRSMVAVVCDRRHLDLIGSLSVSAGPTLSLEGGVELHASRRE